MAVDRFTGNDACTGRRRPCVWSGRQASYSGNCGFAIAIVRQVDAPSRLAAWTSTNPMPDKCVIIMHPHTSNWDFPIGLLTGRAIGLTLKRDALRFAGKESCSVAMGLDFSVVAWAAFRSTARHPQGFVGRMAARFAGEPRMRL